ncbi:MAG: CotH kinase family protein [Mycolicibacterium rufum]|uniref:CotH protein n=1 Tax=Mycolicibacterium chlorophenolicum TaxID=37916 RepID=A0A0J6VQH8_9MYCO|nr:CotH kinase family protein [Mycolicibacterium chlorophenolicum]KMO71727.1 CotH protein [Mycolicibacterium chlorophenolicum]MBI5340726.1 CotH kinase family protein [Mycolicibacterium rufum]
MTALQQQALDSFYAIDNVITIKITMPAAEWDALRNEEPKGGRCNFEFTDGARYTWRKAASVEISGTKFPAATTFTDVGVKKKSFCGSIDSDKPCLHVDFGKLSDANVAGIEDLIGSRYVTLNNSIQDRSYVKQTLGYRLLGMAGLPHSRCNYARVFVNGTPIGQGAAGVNAPGVYVNAEPVMKRYIERNFNGNLKGNLYELEHHDDLVEERLDFIGVEALSKFEDKADLTFACAHIKANGLAGADQVFDMGQFLKIYAMEFFLKHWDGYADNTNNTYLYNDVTAVAAPDVGDIRFTMIPWGIDQTLQPGRPFTLGSDGVIAQLVRNDDARRKQLFDQIRAYRDTVFSRENQQTVLRPLIDEMQALLTGFGVPDVVTEIDLVRQQLRLAESAGYIATGLPGPADPVYILKHDTSACLHASNTESIPPGAPTPANFEVYHQPLKDDNDPADLWALDQLGTGKSLTSKAFGRNLHASASQVTPQGHKYLYTCAPSNGQHAEEFTIAPVPVPVTDPANPPGRFAYTGYFNLVSARTTEMAKFGLDLTPGGRARVHQELPGSNLYFY